MRLRARRGSPGSAGGSAAAPGRRVLRAQADGRPHAGAEVVEGDGLAQAVHGADAVALVDGGVVVAGGEDDDGGVLVDDAADGEAVHVGQVQVENHDVGVRLGEPQGRGAGVAFFDDVAGAFEGAAHDEAGESVVVNDGRAQRWLQVHLGAPGSRRHPA